jgi:hypothetical protein
MAFEQYNPTKVSVIIGAIIGRAFADGEMITVEFAEDKRSMHIGTDGQGRHIRNMNASGTITIRFADYSPTNDLIMALDKADQPFPITVTDKSSTAGLFFADSCTLSKIPNFVRGKEATENEYVFNFTNGTVFQSGATEI